MTTHLGVPSASTPRASNDPEQLRAGLVEACDLIEQYAFDAFGPSVERGWHIGLHEAWQEEDPDDYARWVRLKTLALGVAA